jgi:hypothetical protein
LPHAGTIPTPDLGLAAGSGVGMMKNEVWKRGRFEQGQQFCGTLKRLRASGGLPNDRAEGSFQFLQTVKEADSHRKLRQMAEQAVRVATLQPQFLGKKFVPALSQTSSHIFPW